MAEKADVRGEITTIMEGVMKGLLSIPFPDLAEGHPETPEYITSHWCEKCKRYHRVFTS